MSDAEAGALMKRRRYRAARYMTKKRRGGGGVLRIARPVRQAAAHRTYI